MDLRTIDGAFEYGIIRLYGDAQNRVKRLGVRIRKDMIHQKNAQATLDFIETEYPAIVNRIKNK